MGDDEISPREKLLRLIAAAAPQPWFAREYGEQTRYPLDILLNDLEDLWLEGLLRKGETTAKSAGLLLSPAGEEVLRDPGALLRLREGEPLRPGDRGCVARSLFRLERRRSVTRLFLWLNLLWFGWGFYLAQSRHQAGREFLTVQGNANAAMVQVWHQIGSVSAADLIHGEWWRLLSSCFVHFGLLHLAFTVLWLYTLGARAELLWGRWRFFVIYSLAGSYSTALPMAYRPGTLSGEPRQFVPDLVGGASGALCGLLGAELVWLLFNGRFLPRRIVRRWWFGLALSVLILGALNAFSNVSAVGQIGALVVGAVAATLLTVQGFGPTSVRWLTLLVLAGLLWASYALIERQRATSAVWVEAEKQVYQHDFSARARETLAEGSKGIEPPAAISLEKQLAAASHARQKLGALKADLARAGPFRSKDVIATREADCARVDERLDEVSSREDTLRPLPEKEAKRLEDDERQRTRKQAEDETEEATFTRKFWNRVGNTTAAAGKAFAEQARPQFARNRTDRDPAVRKALAEQRAALRLLAADLEAAGRYRSETAENARRVGLDYVLSMDRLLEMAENRLAADGWTQKAADAMKQQEVTAEQRRSDWLELADKK